MRISAQPRNLTTTPSAGLRSDSARTYLLVACLATLVLWFIPFAGVVTYPLRIFVTFLHEAGHALAAILSLGSVHQIAVYPNGSGVTMTQGGFGLLIASAGYMGSIVAAAALLLALRVLSPRWVLLGLGVTLAMITVGWVRNPFGLAMGAVLSVGLGAAGFYLPPRWAQLTVAFLAVQAGMNAIFDLRTVLLLAGNGHVHNDASNLAQMTGIPALVWALLWSVASAAILWLALRSYRRSPAL
jgi:hypothetical protein